MGDWAGCRQAEFDITFHTGGTAQAVHNCLYHNLDTGDRSPPLIKNKIKRTTPHSQLCQPDRGHCRAAPAQRYGWSCCSGMALAPPPQLLLLFALLLCGLLPGGTRTT